MLREPHQKSLIFYNTHTNHFFKKNYLNLCNTIFRQPSNNTSSQSILEQKVRTQIKLITGHMTKKYAEIAFNPRSALQLPEPIEVHNLVITGALVHEWLKLLELYDLYITSLDRSGIAPDINIEEHPLFREKWLSSIGNLCTYIAIGVDVQRKAV